MRLKGYLIEISNSKDINGNVCYRDNSGNSTAVQTSSCEGSGRYVTIAQRTISKESDITWPILDICEVKIYGKLNLKRNWLKFASDKISNF